MNTTFYYRVIKKYILYHLNFNSPVAVNYGITSRCNLNCNFCLVRKLKFDDELSTSQVLRILDELDNAGVAYLTLTGGEPLLRKDFNEIAKKISEIGISTTLNTNGTLIRRNNAKLIAKSFDTVRISVDGDEKTHDKIMGKIGCYKKTREGIKLLWAVNGRKARICTHFTVNEDNVTGMEQFFKEFNGLSDSISFMPVLEAGKEFKLFSNKKFLDTWKQLSKTKKLNQSDDMIRHPDLRIGKKYCDAAKLYYHILPNGLVTPCSNISRKCFLGNLKEESFKSVIIKPLNDNQKKTLEECKGCFSRCTTEISMLMRKKPFELLLDLPNLLRRYKF